MARPLHAGDPCPCQLVLEVSRQELGHPHLTPTPGGPGDPGLGSLCCSAASVSLSLCIGLTCRSKWSGPEPHPVPQMVLSLCASVGGVSCCGHPGRSWPGPFLQLGPSPSPAATFALKGPIEGLPGEVAGSRLPFPHLRIPDQLGPSVCLWSDCAHACLCVYTWMRGV